MNYSQSDIDFMRKDALRRTREMHRSVNNGKNNQKNPNEKNSNSCEEKSEQHTENNNSQHYEKKESKASADSMSNLISGLFQGGKIDNDKLIIIFLIIFLAKEGVDLKLLIALGYILI